MLMQILTSLALLFICCLNLILYVSDLSYMLWQVVLSEDDFKSFPTEGSRLKPITTTEGVDLEVGRHEDHITLGAVKDNREAMTRDARSGQGYAVHVHTYTPCQHLNYHRNYGFLFSQLMMCRTTISFRLMKSFQVSAQPSYN